MSGTGLACATRNDLLEFCNAVKTMLWGTHFWSPSYCVVSCGAASLEAVKEYINNQRTPPKARDVARSLALTKVKE
ncbi:transposase [Symbiopectobacterium purcellii]|uniref:transposase n=1 Tax=Symbiopectobacterium purcellii TaxID=2871826 RepID=UPI003F84A346